MDITNFENFTEQEYKDNLNRLAIKEHKDLISKEVYYVKQSYGIHKVVDWDSVRGEYLLELEGQRFWSNPFRIKLI